MLAIARRDWTLNFDWQSPPIEVWNVACNNADLVGTISLAESRGVVGFAAQNRCVVISDDGGNWEAWDIDGGHRNPEVTAELQAGLYLHVSDDRLLAIRNVGRQELAGAGPFEINRRIGTLTQEHRGAPLHLKELRNDSLLRRMVSNTRHAWSPDRSLLATLAGRSPIAEIWDVESGELVRTIDYSAVFRNYEISTIHHIVFSSDGSRLLITGASDVVGVWDWPDGRHVRTIRDPVAGGSMRFSADGRLLASRRMADSLMKVWSVETGDVVLNDYLVGYSGLAFSPDGLSVAASDHWGGYEKVKIWGPKDLGICSRSSRRIHAEAVAMLDAITIGPGCNEPEAVSTETPASAMQWVAFLAGEAWTSRPQCACPVITGFVEAINHGIDDETVVDAQSV